MFCSSLMSRSERTACICGWLSLAFPCSTSDEPRWAPYLPGDALVCGPYLPMWFPLLLIFRAVVNWGIWLTPTPNGNLDDLSDRWRPASLESCGTARSNSAASPMSSESDWELRRRSFPWGILSSSRFSYDNWPYLFKISDSLTVSRILPSFALFW